MNNKSIGTIVSKMRTNFSIFKISDALKLIYLLLAPTQYPPNILFHIIYDTHFYNCSL